MQRDWQLMPDAGGSLQIKYSAPGVELANKGTCASEGYKRWN